MTGRRTAAERGPGGASPAKRSHGGRWRVIAAVWLAALLTASCTGIDLPGVAEEATSAPGDAVGGEDAALGDPGDCITVDMAVSSEKIDLMTDLARDFNASDEAQVEGRCVFVRPASKASGRAMQLLSEGWPQPDIDGPAPVVWSPASNAWGTILNQLRSEQGESAMAPVGEPFMLTPLVIAMPEPMAAALGHPDEPIGWSDVLALATNDEGWGAYGHPEWGGFKLGKTNPNFSTSGLSALIAQTYAATGTTSGLTSEDLARPEVQDFARGVESAVVHYGDTTLTFLNNWADGDTRGTALTYASAVAVEEVSLINYNRGNPDGVLEPGEELEPPRVPLVAVYPEEGTLFSDNPYIVLDADWVTAAQRSAAELFGEYVQRPENQQRVLEFGFRPGNPAVAVGEPVTAEFGVDPDQPETTLEVPEPGVMVELLRAWEEQRKSARVLLALDVSGSMGDPAGAGDATKLDLAVEAATGSLEQFKDSDEVGLRVFSTELGDPETDYVDVVGIAPIGDQRTELAQRLDGLIPMLGTPLYTVTADSYSDMVDSYDAAKINAVVLLTDGRNEDPRNDDLAGLLEQLTADSEGRQTQPVRIFPIAYGDDADLATLRRIAEATDAAVYDASDPRSIQQVFDAVISNF